MKQLINGLVLVFIFACASKKQTIRDFITGVYVHEGKSDYSVAYDTLVITALDETSDTYTINKRVGFHIITNNALGPKTYEAAEMTVVFNHATNQLEDVEKRKTFTLMPEQHILMMNKKVYTKIK